MAKECFLNTTPTLGSLFGFSLSPTFVYIPKPLGRKVPSLFSVYSSEQDLIIILPRFYSKFPRFILELCQKKRTFTMMIV